MQTRHHQYLVTYKVLQSCDGIWRTNKA